MSSESSTTRAFDPSKHVTRIKFRGGPERDYLGVAARVMWLRSLYPDAVIETWLLSDEPGVRSTWGARVTLPSGASATGFGSRSKADGRGDYFEAGETRALGRALAHLGIATEYIDPDEMDEGRDDTGQAAAVDSGRERRPSGQSGQPSAQRPLQQAPPPERPLQKPLQPEPAIGRDGEAGLMKWLTDHSIDPEFARKVAGDVYKRSGLYALTTAESRRLRAALTGDLVRADPSGAWVIVEPPAEPTPMQAGE